MAWYGIHKLTTGMNQNATPHPGERWAGRRSARAAVAARNCQTQATTRAASAQSTSTEENPPCVGHGQRTVMVLRGVHRRRSWWPNSRYCRRRSTTMQIRLAKAVTPGKAMAIRASGEIRSSSATRSRASRPLGTHGRDVAAVGGGGGGRPDE